MRIPSRGNSKHRPLVPVLLLLLSLIATSVKAYVTHLKLVVCDIQFACARNPGYMRIPVDLNAGTLLKTVYLDIKEDPASAPITGIQVVKAGDEPPGNTWTRLDGNLNEGAPVADDDNTDNTALFLYYTKDRATSHNPITSMIVKTGSHPVVSADYVRVPMNLNQGVGGESIYLFYSQADNKDPITAISAKACLTDDCYMDGWHRVEKDVNEGVIVGMRVYLFYQRVRGQPPVTDVAVILNDQSTPEGYQKVDVDLNQLTIRGASIHLWYQVKEQPTDDEYKNAIQELAIEYGHPSVVPFGWTRVQADLNSDGDGKGSFGEPTFLFYRRGFPELPKIQPLGFDDVGSFKILQLADLHFTNEEGKCRDVPNDMVCKGDSTTIEGIEGLLDLERPDLVVFSGDNIDGEGVSDARAATFKFADPVIQRKIPWAAIFGNHDDENDLSREELMTTMLQMPYSLTQRGPLHVSGVGNYVLKVLSNKTQEGEHKFSIYFLDSGAYTDDTKKDYDCIKPDQLDWLKDTSASFARNTTDFGSQKPNAMAYFHIPIWEYNEVEGEPNPRLGDKRESVSSPRDGAAKILDAIKEAGDIKVTGCGHDHVNDYCLDRNGVFLCYGGGLGVGGYGAGHLGWPRRARVWEIAYWGDSIRTWKRLHDDQLTMIDFQTLL
ncbi:Metallo-dependent phosphatase-like protein [Zychaea mexicana]|uniref:Metallo-dependent phosphatase-like protein n=1 Tax=Zychaea mexicana TaxID=64656 RepID=UPI0022FE40B3|nr:Metallo-dependent phosphatase-like protein [Zychaea mexicana]KAI9495877.1 Metallo-dependent phosphatase-like protein [Zychaea mexicana]